MTEEIKIEKKELTDEQRENRAILVILGILGVITVIAVIFDSELFGPESIFNDNPTGNSVIDEIYHHIPSLIKTCEILFVALLLFVGLDVLKNRFIKADTHFQTALRLIISFTR